MPITGMMLEAFGQIAEGFIAIFLLPGVLFLLLMSSIIPPIGRMSLTPGVLVLYHSSKAVVSISFWVAIGVLLSRLGH